MKQEDKLSFVDAMENKVSDHKDRGHWTVVHFKTLLKNAKPIKTIQCFKQDRQPDGAFLKHKSRLCTQRGMQEWGDSFWETYLPVFKMLSKRLILAITKIHNIHSKVIDFVLEFPQSDLEEDIWMHLPVVIQVDGQTEAD